MCAKGLSGVSKKNRCVFPVPENPQGVCGAPCRNKYCKDHNPRSKVHRALHRQTHREKIRKYDRAWKRQKRGGGTCQYIICLETGQRCGKAVGYRRHMYCDEHALLAEQKQAKRKRKFSVCQYSVEGVLCGVSLEGKGALRYCPVHRVIVRRETLRRNATKYWRKMNLRPAN